MASCRREFRRQQRRQDRLHDHWRRHLEQVDVHVEPQSEYVDVTIRWHGGFTSQHEIARSVGKYEQLRDYDRLVERITQLHAEGTTVPRIAEKLNEEGFVPPRRRGKYSTRVLAPLLKQLGFVAEINHANVLKEHEWWVQSHPDCVWMIGVIRREERRRKNKKPRRHPKRRKRYPI